MYACWMYVQVHVHIHAHMCGSQGLISHVFLNSSHLYYYYYSWIITEPRVLATTNLASQLFPENAYLHLSSAKSEISCYTFLNWPTFYLGAYDSNPNLPVYVANDLSAEPSSPQL